MLSGLEDSWLRVALYLTVAALAVAEGWIEVRQARRRGPHRDLWPAFWFLNAGVFAFMAVARAGDLVDLLSELGRRQAAASGWYEDRRGLQAAVVGAIGVVWVVTVVVSLWRVPERRRRYLPPALVTFTIMCFAAVRMVSLHHVDAVLHRRQIAGVEIGALVEVALLVMAMVVTVWHRRSAVTAVEQSALVTAPPGPP